VVVVVVVVAKGIEWWTLRWLLLLILIGRSGSHDTVAELAFHAGKKW